MRQSRVFVLLIFQLNFIQFIECPCPIDFLDAGSGVCLKTIQRSATYCEAHDYCEKEGMRLGLRLFLPGRNVAKMIPYIPPSAGAFTGLTKLLNGSASDMSAGWRYSDPGWSWFVTGLNDKSIPWSTNDPHVALEFVGLLVSSNLWDVPQTKYFATQIFCELASNATNTTDDSLQLDWPYPMPSLFLPDNTSLGCFTSSIAPTIFHCCDNCRSRLACRALYYHLETGQCWLSLYVDSLLPTNMSTIQGKWRRFGRPNW